MAKIIMDKPTQQRRKKRLIEKRKKKNYMLTEYDTSFLTVRKSATDFPKEPSPTSSSIRFLEVDMKTKQTPYKE